jgi:hypothetical protein
VRATNQKTSENPFPNLKPLSARPDYITSWNSKPFYFLLANSTFANVIFSRQTHTQNGNPRDFGKGFAPAQRPR